MTVFAVSMGSVEGKWALLSQNTHALIAASLGTAFFLRARRGLAQTGSWVGLLRISAQTGFNMRPERVATLAMTPATQELRTAEAKKLSSHPF